MYSRTTPSCTKSIYHGILYLNSINMFSELNKLGRSLHFAHVTCPLSKLTHITQRVYDNNKHLQRISILIVLPLQKHTCNLISNIICTDEYSVNINVILHLHKCVTSRDIIVVLSIYVNVHSVHFKNKTASQ